MKKVLFSFFFLFSFLYPQNISGIQSIIFKHQIKRYYEINSAYYKTKSLIYLINKMINTDKFVNYINQKEKTEVKAYTYTLLKGLLSVLRGQKPYSNTYFLNNNPKTGGIFGILKKYRQNPVFLDLPVGMKKEISAISLSSQFFAVEKNILHMLDKHRYTDVIKSFNLLFSNYVSNMEKLKNNDLLSKSDSSTMDVLVREYRIEGLKTSLIKALEIYKKYFIQNEKVYR